MPDLHRIAPGRYGGNWCDHDFEIAKLSDQQWEGVCASLQLRHVALQRKEAVRRMRDAIEEALIEVPELDALLARWARDVRDVAHRFEACPSDRVHIALMDLRHDLQRVDGTIRTLAVRFARDLHRLRLAQAKVERAVEDCT